VRSAPPMKKKKAVKKSTLHTNKKLQPSSHGVRPLGDRILVKPVSPEEMHKTTSFGIIIPDTAKEKPEQGTVIAVGPGKQNDDGKFLPLSVKVGDKVMFSKYGFEEVKINGV